MRLEALAALVGTELGVSRWFTIDQARIDAFATLCEDEQFIHVDPVAAARTRFGGTVAHGFLTLSMLSAMASDAQPRLDGTRLSVNYGFDRVRFLTPVPSGGRVRGRFVLAAVEERRPGAVLLTTEATVELEACARPALAARWLTLREVEASPSGESAARSDGTV